MKRSLVVMAIILAACGAADPVATDSTSTSTITAAPPQTLPSDDSRVDKPTGSEAKLASRLIQALHLAEAGMGIDEIAAELPELRFDDGGVMIEVTFDDLTDVERAAAVAVGLHITGDYPDLRLLTGSISPSGLLDLADLDSVVSIAAALGATTG
jgi:hypothetical protein